jgi:hypothetical protein
MDSYRTAARVTDGKLDLDRARLSAALASMKDGPVEVTVERKRSTRTVQQNRFYFKTIVEAIAIETGQDRESVHEALKRECNAKHVEMVNKATGEVFETWIGASTTSLNTSDFSSYIERCRAFAAQFFGLTFEEQTP